MGLVVIKLGGSLLKRRDWPDRLHLVLEQRRANQVLLVVGGGSAADVVRDWSTLYGLSEETAHAVALRSLSLTRLLMQRLMPDLLEVATREEALRYWERHQTPVLLDVERCLEDAERGDGRPLPHNWNVTTDSIAAWVASRWRADELILLKSTTLAAGSDVKQAAECEFVDPYFPEVAGDVSQIRWCNLLDEPLQIRDWLRDGKLVDASEVGCGNSV